MAVPTEEYVKSKEREIKNALIYKYTDQDVDRIVATKERFHKHPKNYAMFKSRLMRDKEIASANGDDEKAKQLEEQLTELEERAEELDRKRTSTIATVALINDRNRKANVSKAEESIREEIARKKIEGEASNPFIRRKCRPRMVTKPTIQSSADLQRALAEKENQEKAAKEKAAESAAAAAKGPPSKKAKTDGTGDADASKEDLFDAHDFDIEIDVDTTDGGGAVHPAVSMTTHSVNSGNGVGGTEGAGPKIDPGPSKKSLNLDAYKKKRGLI